MKTKNLFEDITNEFQDVSMRTRVFDKPEIKERIRNTRLESAGTFFTIEKWNPEDERISINWKIENTLFGVILIASTSKGICYMGFIGNDREAAMKDFKDRFLSNKFLEKADNWQREAIRKINAPHLNLPVYLHLKGSDFQLRIWKRLALVPFDGLVTYLELGENPKDARAAGRAVGANPVSILLGCHRVVHADGNIEGYHWGDKIKKQLLTYEVEN